MGAWGPGSFENDDALDWAADTHTIADIENIFAELKSASDAHDSPEPFYMDAPQASKLIAAAEMVATLKGRPAKDVPGALIARFKNSNEPNVNMVARAQNAISMVLGYSELSELWAASGDEISSWNLAITDLIARLNPHDADPKLSLPEILERSPNNDEPNCAFCGQPVAAEELLEMNVTDFRQASTISSYMWIHLRCLNARVQPSMMMQDFQYNIRNLPDFDAL